PRLDVAVHDRVRMRDREALAHLHHQVEPALERQLADAFQVFAERLALEQFHYHVEPPVLLPHFVDVDDVAVQHLPGDARFALEAHAGFTVTLQVRHHELDRDGATRRDLARAVDHAHGAAADAFDDAELSDALGHGRARGRGNGN